MGTMTTRTRIILLLAVVLVVFLTSACVDMDIDRSGFEATATASVRTEMARRQVDAQATQVAER